MWKCEKKAAVLKILQNNGPMTIKQVAEQLKMASSDLHGIMMSLSLAGLVYKVKRDRHNGSIWAAK